MKVTKLADKALLVKLTRRMANLTRRDAMLTQQVRMQENDNSIDVLMKLFSNKASDIYDVKQTYNEVYQYHKMHTLPYTDAGPRILPNNMYFEYTQEMKHLIAKVEKKLAAILPHYDQLVHEDIMYRNASITKTARASVSDYPTAEQFGQSMSIDLRFSPLPDASHFLFDISEEDKQAFERSEMEMSALALVLTRNGYRHRPVIGIKKPQDGRARDHLIVENQLAVIAGVLHFSQLAIKALQAIGNILWVRE